MTVYSKDLRERALKYIQEGHSYRDTAKVFDVGANASAILFAIYSHFFSSAKSVIPESAKRERS